MNSKEKMKMITDTVQGLVEDSGLVSLITKEAFSHLDLFFNTNPSYTEDRSRHLHIVFGDLFRNARGIHTQDLDAARLIARGIVTCPNPNDPALVKARDDYRDFEELYGN